MNDEQQITGLRQEIRWVGRWTRCWRWGGLLPCVIVAWRLMASSTFFFATSRVFPRLSLRAFLDYLSPAAVLSGCLLSLLAATCYRSLRRIQLGQTLAALPPDQLADLLAPLLSDRSADTRKLAASLAHRLRVPTELAPAPAPEGRGDEAAGV